MSFQLTIEPVGETVDVEHDQSLLDAALRSGIWLPYACNHGLCGTCKVQLLEGEVEHNDSSPFALMDIERDEGKCLACSATPLSDIVIEADIEEDEDAMNLPIGDYTGTVAEIVELTPTIKGVYIEIEGTGVEFQAGQYLNLKLPGIEPPRAFSFANPPSQSNRIELNVRQVPDGAATAYIHNDLRLGDDLQFTAPLGRFFVRKSQPEPIVFLAGGSGLSSPKSMILDLLQGGDTRPITLVYGARNKAELYYEGLFEDLAASHGNFTYVPALSEPDDAEAWDGETGFVHDVACRCFDGRFAGHNAYLCGPPPMIDACISVLMQGRCFENHIFMEAFLTAEDGAKPARRSALFKKF